jgi:hypothetical protein
VLKGVGTAGVLNGVALMYAAYYGAPTALALEVFAASQNKRGNHLLAIDLYRVAGHGHRLVYAMMERALYMPARAAVLGKLGTIMAIFGAGQSMYGLLEYKEEVYNVISRVTGSHLRLAFESMSSAGMVRFVYDTVAFRAEPWDYVYLAQEALEARQDGDMERAASVGREIEARLSRYQ